MAPFGAKLGELESFLVDMTRELVSRDGLILDLRYNTGGNVHASVIRTADGLRDELTEHLVHGVQWTGTIRRMAAEGVTEFVEIGPGRVLTGLIRRINPQAETFAVDVPGSGGIWLPGATPDANPDA